MPALKHVQRSATPAFSPNAPFIALGSVAGAVDPTFSTSSTLEIRRLDFASNEAEMPLAGCAVTAPERFERLAWGAIGLDPAGKPAGMLAGGLTDGSICLWNPAKMMGAKPGQDDVPSAAIATLRKHRGPSRGWSSTPAAQTCWRRAPRTGTSSFGT